MSKVSHSVRTLLTRVGLRRSPWLPQPLYDDDVFLVTYPKSGTTWLRFQIANLIRQPHDDEIDFHNIHDVVPDISSPRAQALSRRPRILSTHAPYTREFGKVIYVVRDGRDVYVSYYHHLRRSLPAGMTFGQFLRRGVKWPGRWSSHVTGWLENADPQQLLIVRYEDMLAKGPATLRHVADFIGIEATDRAVQDAVERSAFDKMRRVESAKVRCDADSGPQRFVRKGVVGDWARTFSPADLAFFNDVERKAMDRLGYATNDESQGLRSVA